MRRFSLLPLVCALSVACAKQSAPASEDAVAAAPEPQASPDASRPMPEHEAEASQAGAPVSARDGIIAEAKPQPGGGDDASDQDRAALDVRVPAINGGLHRDIIRRTAGTHEAEIRGCVPAALAQNPGLAETLELELEYGKDGQVESATIPERSGFSLSAVEDCVRELAEGWRFPAPDDAEAGSLTLELRLQ